MKILRQVSFSKKAIGKTKNKIFSEGSIAVPLSLGAIGAGIGSIVGSGIGHEKGAKAARERSRKEAIKDYDSGKILKDQKEKLKSAKLMAKNIKSWKKEKDAPKDTLNILENITNEDIKGYQTNIDRITGKYGELSQRGAREQLIEESSKKKYAAKKEEIEERRKQGTKRGAAIGGAIGTLGGVALNRLARR